MNNKFISNSVNFIFAFCWLIFFSVFAFEIFNSFFGRPAYYISNPANILKHRQIYFAIVIAYGIAFAFLYRSFFFKQATLAKRAGLLAVSLTMVGGCWYYVLNFLKFYWY